MHRPVGHEGANKHLVEASLSPITTTSGFWHLEHYKEAAAAGGGHIKLMNVR